MTAFLRNFVYRQIAQRRYKWFGKYESCRLPSPDEQDRFQKHFVDLA